MSTVSIKDGKNRFSELVRAAEGGETIVITRNGEPVCEITPYKKRGGTDWEAGEKFLRDRGIDRIASWVSPDFDDPLPEDFSSRPCRRTLTSRSRREGNEAPAR
ncbi:MAG: type II toxin-antitoxin system prevent-host-death family antitoxin [Rhizomicrobium sp.]